MIISKALAVGLGLALGVWAQSSQVDPVEIIRKSVERDRMNSRRAKDYTFVQRVEQREFDKGGKVKKVESNTFDVTMIGERPYSKKIAKDDKPLSEKEARKVQEEFDKEIRKRQEESESDRKKRAAELEKQREEGRRFLLEIPQAFDFKLVGEETVEGHPVWVIDAKPRPGYKGSARRWELLTKFHGRLWVDQKEYQWVRVEADTIAPVSFGWLLARLEPGAKLTFQQARINSEIWLPVKATTRLNARLALLKKINGEFEVTWKDYKKFQTDSRMVDVAETAPRQDRLP
jgi:hypothetical protein